MNTQSILQHAISIPSYFATRVLVEAVEVEEDGSYFLRVRTDAGQLVEINLTSDEFEEAVKSAQTQTTSIISASYQTLLVETERIQLAYVYDPHFAVSLSGVEPLPHQAEKSAQKSVSISLELP